jgi:hypothetical protein
MVDAGSLQTDGRIIVTTGAWVEEIDLKVNRITRRKDGNLVEVLDLKTNYKKVQKFLWSFSKRAKNVAYRSEYETPRGRFFGCIEDATLRLWSKAYELSRANRSWLRRMHDDIIAAGPPLNSGDGLILNFDGSLSQPLPGTNMAIPLTPSLGAAGSGFGD